MQSKIKVTHRGHSDDLGEQFEVGGEVYHIQTEDLGKKSAKIVTRIYLQGEIVNSLDSDYSHLLKTPELPELKEKILALAAKQHKTAKEAFIRKQVEPLRSKAEYFSDLKKQLASCDLKAALETTIEALKEYRHDPLFLSYQGYLTAAVENKHHEGSRICREAMTILKKSKTVDLVLLLPLFYLNLGKAYMAGSRKKDAMAAFQDGLRYDANNAALLEEMKNFRTRKKPVLPFLERSHPLNIYFGRLRTKNSTK